MMPKRLTSVILAMMMSSFAGLALADTKAAATTEAETPVPATETTPKETDTPKEATSPSAKNEQENDVRAPETTEANDMAATENKAEATEEDTAKAPQVDYVYLLLTYNSYAMTMSTLASSESLEHCEIAKTNLEEVFPAKTSISFQCVPVPKTMDW